MDNLRLERVSAQGFLGFQPRDILLQVFRDDVPLGYVWQVDGVWAADVEPSLAPAFTSETSQGAAEALAIR